MKKILGLMVLMLMLTGCFGEEDTGEANGEETFQEEQQNEAKQEEGLNLFEDGPGVDPLYPDRFPGSVRTNHVQNSFVIYIAEASIEEVLEFYRSQAEERGNEFNYEELPEDHPYWFYGYEDYETRTGGFAGTLGYSEDCDNCVEWVLYAFEWPGN